MNYLHVVFIEEFNTVVCNLKQKTI